MTTLVGILREIQEQAHLVHVTPLHNLSSVIKHGVVSPEEAQRLGATSGIGSEGSNHLVVQLFDYTCLNLASACDQLRDLLGTCASLEPRCAMVVIDQSVRTAPEFRSHWKVQQEARHSIPEVRYYPETEVWFASERLEASKIVKVWTIDREKAAWTGRCYP